MAKIRYNLYQLFKSTRKGVGWWARFTHSTATLYAFRNFLMLLLRGVIKRCFGFNDDALKRFDLEWRHYYKHVMQNKSVLDVGCGLADHGKEIMETGSASTVFGVDLSLGLVASATSAYPAYYFCVADACNLPFHDKSVDVVVANFTFHHIEVSNRALALKELMRVARSAVILRDVFGVRKGVLGSLYKYYYSIVDGSFCRYTLSEWLDFIQSCNAELVKTFYTDENSVVNRHCCFVIKESGN